MLSDHTKEQIVKELRKRFRDPEHLGDWELEEIVAGRLPGLSLTADSQSKEAASAAPEGAVR